MHEIEVHVDERIRLLTTILMLTDFPDQEQRYQPHKLHPLAEVVRQKLSNLRNHPSILTVGEIIKVQPFLFLVPHFIRLSWPELHLIHALVAEPWEEIPAMDSEGFRESLRDFHREIQRLKLWEQTTDMWKATEDELKSVLNERDLAGFLSRFWGETKKFIVVPNPLVPRTEAVGAFTSEAYYAIIPPKLVPLHSPDSTGYLSQPLQVRWTVCHELSHGPLFDAQHRVSGLENDITEVIDRTSTSERFRTFYDNPLWRFTEVLIRAIQVLYLRHCEEPEAEELFLRHEREKNGLVALADWADQLEPYVEGDKRMSIMFLTNSCQGLYMICEHEKHINAPTSSKPLGVCCSGLGGFEPDRQR